MRYGTLQKRDTLTLCLLKLQLMEWRFDSAWKFGLGDFTSDERAVNGPVPVERVQKGDQKAFNLLVVRYQHKVASLVSRYVPSGDVPDVVQEALLKPIVRWIRSGEIALLYMAVSDCCKYSENYRLLRGVVHLPVMWMPLKLKTSKVAAR